MYHCKSAAYASFKFLFICAETATRRITPKELSDFEEETSAVTILPAMRPKVRVTLAPEIQNSLRAIQ